jgi:four helix bundle protein
MLKFADMVQRFQDLICWQKALELTDKVYESTEYLKDFTLKDQLRRAAVSSMNNIAEGFGRFHSKDTKRFLEYSTSSCLEIESMTYLMERRKILEPHQIESIRAKAVETFKVTAGFAKSIK